MLLDHVCGLAGDWMAGWASSAGWLMAVVVRVCFWVGSLSATQSDEASFFVGLCRFISFHLGVSAIWCFGCVANLLFLGVFCRACCCCFFFRWATPFMLFSLFSTSFRVSIL